MYSSYTLKDKYPYWWTNKEKEEREREIRDYLEMAKLEIRNRYVYQGKDRRYRKTNQ